MSHQSGIQVAEPLAKLFIEASGESPNGPRFLVVRIDDESLQVHQTEPKSGDAEQDFATVHAFASDAQPCYILFLLDSDSVKSADSSQSSPTGPFETQQQNWLFISYIPDQGNVRDKMLYAATQATLLKQLGSNRFRYIVHAKSPQDLRLDTLSAFLRYHVQRPDNAESDMPLTEREQELRRIRQEEITSAEHIAATASSARRTHLKTAHFPLTDRTYQVFEQFFALEDTEGTPTTVVLRLDIAKEATELDARVHGDEPNPSPVTFASLGELQAALPTQEPRFVVHRYRYPSHNDSGRYYPLFIYLCSTQASIKERMIYSTCRRTLVHLLQETYGITFTKRFELDEPSELTQQLLDETLHSLVTAPPVSGDRIHFPDFGDSTNTGESVLPVASHTTLPQRQFKRPSAPGRPRTLPQRSH
ncbi:Twinfilin-1 [Dispira simplex]|nr:Twinfilin-1 [Dispira simplex]